MTEPAQPAPLGPQVLEGDETATFLDDLGVGANVIHRSILKGDEARNRVSGTFYPVSYAGTTMWAESLHWLRRSLSDRNDDWKNGKTGNYETVYSPSRGAAFAVVAGDKNTGLKTNQHPKLTRKRGPKAEKRVNRNRMIGQLDLFPELQDMNGLPEDEACTTYFILVFADPKSDEVRLEVSLPLRIGDDGLIIEWSVRALLEPVVAQGAVTPDDNDGYGDGGTDDDDDLITRQ